MPFRNWYCWPPTPPGKATAGSPGSSCWTSSWKTARCRARVPREDFPPACRGRGAAQRQGPGGGFCLARPADEITLLQIIEAVDGSSRADACVVGLSRCDDTMPCPQHDLFKPIRQRLKAYLATTTLADTAASLREKRAAAKTSPSSDTAPK